MTTAVPGSDAPSGPSRPGEAEFLGREAEREVVRAALSAASAGRPSIVLVSGEAGIGKSRLVRELLRADSARAFVGLADPLSGDAVPYGPWLEIFRGLRDPAASDSDEPPTITGRLEISRAAFLRDRFEAIASRAADTPLTIVLEDLQWADDASLDLLVYVVRHMTDQRLLVVCTLRTGSTSTATNNAVAELLASPDSQLVSLAPLGDNELERVVEGVAAGKSITREAVARIREDSGGNTFFAVELAASYPAPSAKLRELIGRRLARLSPPTLLAVRLLAVVGRPVSHALLVDLLRSSGQESVASDVVDPAIDVGLVRASRDDPLSIEYDFVHGLAHLFALESISPGILAPLHRAVAATLVQPVFSAFTTSGEVAEHWYRAGDIDMALSAAVLAGVEAMDVVAPKQADLHLARAIELWSRTSRQTVLDRTYPDLLKLLAGAKRWLGELPEAIALLERAMTVEVDFEARASLLERIARMRFESGDAPGAMIAYEQASALLENEKPSPLAMQVDAARASLLMLSGHHTRAVETARPVVERALAIGALRQAGYALMTQGTSQVALGEVEEGMRNLAEAQRLAEESGDVEEQLRADTSLCIALDNQGRLVESKLAAARAWDLSRQHSLDGSLGMSAQANYIEMLWSLGEWTEIDEIEPPRLGATGAAQYESFLIVVRAQLDVARGDFPAARSALGRAESLIDETQPARYVPLLLARGQLELWSHQPELAWQAIAQCFELLPGLDEPTLLAWSCAVALRAAADAVGTGAHASNPAWAARAREASIALREIDEAAAHSPQANAWALTARADLQRMRHRDASAQWALAASAWEQLSRPYEWAYALWRLCEARAAAHDREAASSALNTARAVTRSLHCTPLADELERVGARWHLPRFGDDSAVVPATPWNLTVRELEVLREICAGISNKQIASKLEISTRTVGVHVSHVLQKMVVGTRTEAAVKAERAGMRLTWETV